MEIARKSLSVALVVTALTSTYAFGNPAEALVSLKGAEFKGGGKELFGSAIDGEHLNYVYAEPTGKYSRMEVKFNLASLPSDELFVHLRGRDDDGPKQCTIALELNGKRIFEGPSKFSSNSFNFQSFAIPSGTLIVGENTLVIANLEKQGRTGKPPWLQVAAFAVGLGQYSAVQEIHNNFYVTLPKEKKPFPEPLPTGKSPGFKWRGTKGWQWKPEQYLAEIPVIAHSKGNFLMNCYSSMCDLENYKWGNPNCNRWWEPLPVEKKRAYEEVVRECQKHQIEFCFSMNPNLSSKRIVNDGAPESVDQLYQHFAWMQGLGVNWFNISLDDISKGVDASAQARVVNEIFHRLQAKNPEAQMIFCPTFYWGDGTETNQLGLKMHQQPYLETLARELDKDVYLFWTGNGSVGKATVSAAKNFRRLGGHRLFFWDNYPVNDDNPTLHLGPVTDRDPDLSKVIDGYMSNPLSKQNEINRIPLLTCLDYAWNPEAYDPIRSLGQAILMQAEKPSQQEILRDLVETYPGFLIYNSPRGTGFNAVQEQFTRILNSAHSRQVAIAFIEHLQKLSERFQQEFPKRYRAEKVTLDNDIVKVRQRYTAKYGAGE